MGQKIGLRLFKIERSKEEETLYFDHKMLARKKRDELTDQGENATVRRGPDHWRGETY